MPPLLSELWDLGRVTDPALVLKFCLI